MEGFVFSVNGGKQDIARFMDIMPSRGRIIANGSTEPATPILPANMIAAAVHPKRQHFKVADIKAQPGGKTFTLKGETAATFRAGQYVSIILEIDGSRITRPVSLCSSPKLAADGIYMLTVRRAADGFASGWILDNWKIGDDVVTSGPEGVFAFEPNRDEKNIVGIAGGSGITPFMSMASAISDGIMDCSLTLIYGVRTLEDAIFRSELDAISSANDKIKVVYVLSEGDVAGYEKGFITAELIKKYAPDTYSVFICGPSAMYNFVDREIEKLGLDKKHIRHELFAAPKSPSKIKGYEGDESAVYTLTVDMYGESRDITMLAKEPVLIALERAGIEAPSRCRGGECGFCRSRVISGKAFVPEDMDGRRAADVKAGYIHPCCTYPLSDMHIEIWP